jgi:hypothetical protein
MKYTEQQIIKAMKGTGGIISQILNNLKNLSKPADFTYTRQSLKERIDKNENLREAYISEQENISDIAETGFFRALQEEKDWAIKEWFKYKGSTRGYIVKQQNEIAGDINVALVEFVKSNEDEDTNTR